MSSTSATFRIWAAAMSTNQDSTDVLETTQPLTRDGVGFIIGALEIQLPEYEIAPVRKVLNYRPLQNHGNGYCILIGIQKHGGTRCNAYWIFSSDDDNGSRVQIMRAQ